MSDIERTPKVFISYRRDDAPAHAGRVADHLRAAFGEGSVFMDVESIGAGVEFAREIDNAIRDADAQLVVIGPGWLDARTADGKRRLDEERDFVRAEIIAGLASKVRVIPVLVGGAVMPPQDLLPVAIAELASRNAFELLDRRWREDVEALVDVLRGRVTACPACGQENSSRAAFCMACGTPLYELAPAREIRKVVTVMACEASVSGDDEIDPEDARALLRPIRDLVRLEVERFGGTVERSIGDTIVSVFGAPVAHEDDAERAVRSALRILEPADADEGSAFSVQIGVETGEALVQPGARPEAGEELITGTVVDRSLRLLLRSTEDVVVGEQTHEATRDLFVYEELGAGEGITRSGRAFRTTTARSRFGTDLTIKHTTPLVGREVDLALLRGAFDKALAASNVQLVTIVGEPGVGKSRLLSELFAYTDGLPDLVRWRQGRCLPYGDGITFWALGEIVKAHAGVLESDDPATAASKIDAVIPDSTPDASWLRQRLRPLVGLEAPSAEREENFGAWRAFLESLASDGPAVIVFEDLHWADESFLAFIRDVVDHPIDVPLFVVALARAELYSKSPDWAGGLRNATTLNLDPLSEADTARLVSELLGQAVLPIDVQHAVVERAGGNPLYAEEFVRLLKDREILVERSGSWRLDPTATIPMPVSVQALIASRVDTLSEDEQLLLQDAAVIGKVFWTGALAQMAGRPEPEIEPQLLALGRRELVRPTRRSSIDGESEYSFWHALVRDVCYGQIPKRSRAEKHVAAAEWLQGVAGERVEDLAEILAAHYDAALRASGSSGSAEIRGRAITYLRLAGERALGLDPASAERNFSRALELMSPDDPERPRVLVREGEALIARARYSEALSRFDEAIRGFRERGDEHAAAVASLASGPALVNTGDPSARQVVREALATLSSEGPSSDLVQALAIEAAERTLTDGDLQGGIEAADRAIGMAASLGLETPVRALGHRGVARAFSGDVGGLDDLREAVALAQDQGLSRERLSCLFNLTVFEMQVSVGPALQLQRDGLSLAERLGHEEMALGFRGLLIGGLGTTGSWDEALLNAEDLASDLEAHGALWDLIQVRLNEAMMMAVRGAPEEAQPLAAWALEQARRTGEQQMLVSSLATAMYVTYRLGDRAPARQMLMELLSEELRTDPRLVLSAPMIAEVGLGLGMADSVRAFLADIKPHWLGERASAGVARAMLAESDGDAGTAARLFREAADFAEQLGDVPTRASALLGLGRSLIASEEGAAATGSLEEARAMFASMGAQPWLHEAEELLKRLQRDAS